MEFYEEIKKLKEKSDEMSLDECYEYCSTIPHIRATAIMMRRLVDEIEKLKKENNRFSSLLGE